MIEPSKLPKADSLDGGVTITPGGPQQVAAAAMPEPEPEVAGASAPAPLTQTRIGVGEAIRWHWITFAIPVVLITVLAALAGLARTPDYTAEAKLAISENAGGPAGLAGFAANSESLAAGFSQAMHAPGVVRRISDQTHLPRGEITPRVTASSTSGSPVVRVQATDSTSSSAIELANAASTALIGYINAINGDGGAGKALLKDFEAATVKVNRLSSHLKALESSGADTNAINEARAARDAAKLQAGTSSTAYETSQANRASAGRLQVLSPAGGASSDRRSRLELLVFFGLLVGFAVGAALASLRANGWGWPRLG